MSRHQRGFVVLKFGGTSVVQAEYWPTIRQVLVERLDAGLRPIVVCSALAGVTNLLERLPEVLGVESMARATLGAIRDAHVGLADRLGLEHRRGLEDGLRGLEGLVAEARRRPAVDLVIRAEILAQGELLSSRLGHDWLAQQGLPVRWQDVREWLVSEGDDDTWESYLSVACRHAPDRAAAERLRKSTARVVMTQGFLARNPRGHTVLLGRGGSDTSASYLAVKFEAVATEIWTDVPGVFTANPREVGNARLLEHLSYAEAEALARRGAKVLHPRCLAPLRDAGIPLELHWIDRPSMPGTRLDLDDAATGVKGIGHRDGLHLLTIRPADGGWPATGFAAELKRQILENGLTTDLWSDSPEQIRAAFDAAAVPGLQQRLERLKEQLVSTCHTTVDAGFSSVSLVGLGAPAQAEGERSLAERIRAEASYVACRASDDLGETVVVPAGRAPSLIRDLHRTLFETDPGPRGVGPSWTELTETRQDRARAAGPARGEPPMKTEDVFDRYESVVRSYSRAFPCLLDRAVGSEMWDTGGTRYLDFLAGCGSLNYGHNHPVLKQALMDYIARDSIAHSLDLRTAAKERFLCALHEIVLEPLGMSDWVVQFPGPTGTNAVEAALKIARKVTGRTNVVCFTNGFHGVSAGALAATGSRYHRQAAHVPLFGTTAFAFDGYFGRDVDTMDYLERMLDDASSGVDQPAAAIVETVQGEGGLTAARPEWLQRLREICDRHEVLLIVDDIQAGCGRTGTFLSFEPSGIRPDIVTLSKSLSGYGLPLSVVLLDRKHDQWKPGEHNGTFRGNNHAFVTATAALEHFWRDDAFATEVRAKGDHLGERLFDIAARYPHDVVELRGRGMMRGIRCADPVRAASITARAFRKRLILERSGPRDEVVKFLMPLTISRDDLDEGLDIVAHCFRAEFDRPAAPSRKAGARRSRPAPAYDQPRV